MKLQRSTIRGLLSTTAFSLTLAACGGGGSGDTPPPPPPPPPSSTTPTEITGDNMNLIAASGMLVADVASFDPGLGSFSGAGASSAVLRNVDAALAAVPVSANVSLSQSAAPALALSPPPPPDLLLPVATVPCPDGGNLNISVVDSNLNKQADQNEPYRVTANACKDGTETTSGYFEIMITSLTRASGVVASADYSVNFVSFATSEGNRSNQLGGTLSFKLRSVAGHAETTMQGTPFIMHIEADRQLPIGNVDNSYTATLTELDANAYAVDFSSRTRLGDGGSNTPLAGLIVTRTTSPIRYSADGKIVSGSMRISLEGKPATLDITFVDDTATLALDADGNGTVDTTRVVTRQALASVF
ncbi:hypothetical protein GCM10025771_01800 [Niveibacterium umoris]|uniref:DUF4382 domain-containing protein n=1 Tax=Niveibacterium umoris TaxID=1193620 RepID=A0A840BVC2_9RHOO|nr:hypothetical protein [Niveibacterium umoris]MBB4014277.1 hypothetical protein [Niveibacterium umoris]